MFTHLIVCIIILCAQLLCGSISVQAAPKTEAVVQKAIPLTPEKLKGKIIYTQENGLWAIDPDTRQKQLIFASEFPIFPEQIAFSPDRTTIALVSARDIFLVNWDGTQRRQLTKHSPDTVENFRWSPDGKRIAYTLGTHYIEGGASYSRELRVVDVNGANDHALAGSINGGPSAFDPFWSRDAKRVMFTFFSGDLAYEDLGPPARQTRVIELDGSNDQLFDGNWSDFDLPFVSRDGKWIAKFDGSVGQLDLYELPENKRYRVLWLGGTENLTLWAPIFGPDAKQMVAPAYRGELNTASMKRSIWLVSRDGNTPIGLLVENAELVDWL